MASQNGQEATAKLLLDRGAQVDLANKNGSTSLFVASQTGQEATAKLLLDRGAHVDLAKKDGCTPLYIASQNGQEATAKLLLSRGAQVDLAMNSGATPLFISLRKKYIAIALMLVRRGADLEVSYHGSTVESVALQYNPNNTDLVRWLRAMRDLTTPVLRACEHPTDAVAEVRRALRTRCGRHALDAHTRTGFTALELATKPKRWSLRSLVNEGVAEVLRAAMEPVFSMVQPVASFALAPASYRAYVMPELLLVLGKDLSEELDAERRRPGLPGYPSADVVLRILSFLEREASFDWGPRLGVHFCGLCGVSDATVALTRCLGCKRVWYCSREHQHAAWKPHKKACRKAAKRAANKAKQRVDMG